MSWPSVCSSRVQLWRNCAGRSSSMTKTRTELLQGRRCWRSCRYYEHFKQEHVQHIVMPITFVCFGWQAVYKMSVAASLTEQNPLTAEECTNRIFVRLDKDKNGEVCSVALAVRQKNQILYVCNHKLTFLCLQRSSVWRSSQRERFGMIGSERCWNVTPTRWKWTGPSGGTHFWGPVRKWDKLIRWIGSLWWFNFSDNQHGIR